MRRTRTLETNSVRYYDTSWYLYQSASLTTSTAKSKKQRKLAAKRQKAHEAKLLAEGNLEALAPKIPIQHQSVNILGEENQGVEHNVEAAQKREELKRAMRKERKAKIKETNYLKSM